MKVQFVPKANNYLDELNYNAHICTIAQLFSFLFNNQAWKVFKESSSTHSKSIIYIYINFADSSPRLITLRYHKTFHLRSYWST